MADPVQTELKLLTAGRIGLVDEYVHVVLRLQDLLGTVSPAIERVLDVTRKGRVRLPAKWQPPTTIRRAPPMVSSPGSVVARTVRSPCGTHWSP
jgi:hypothetical protein